MQEKCRPELTSLTNLPIVTVSEKKNDGIFKEVLIDTPLI